MNYHHRSNRLFLHFFLAILVVLAGCSSNKPRTSPQNPYLPPPEPSATMHNPGTYDPTLPLPPGELGTPINPGGTVTQTEPLHPGTPRIALVVGGAGVASYATVGLLKRFHEEGIRFDMIVATGWPALFAIGFGFMKSVHDLEWFAMRLQDKDFESISSLSPGTDPGLYEKVSPLIRDTFRQRDLSETRLPIYLMTGNTEHGEVGAYDRGSWKVPLLETMSIPGLYRSFGDEPDPYRQTEAISVDEATRRHADVIVAVSMYADYIDFVLFGGAGKEGVDSQKAYGRAVQNSVNEQLRTATFSGRVAIGSKTPTSLGSKRAALLAGYREGTRLAREVRKLLHR